MSKAAVLDASRPDFDQVIQNIVDYVLDYDVTQSDEAMQTARYCWMDTIGCGLYALNYPACSKMLGPVVPDAGMANGARVPGTSYQLDPVRAAWNIGAMVRWLDSRATGEVQENEMPEFASDRCLDDNGNLIARGDGVWDGTWNGKNEGVCTQQYPFFQSSRQAAGDNSTASVLFCHLVSVKDAIESGVYAPLDASPYQTQLETLFPDGVCDYRQGDMTKSW